MDLAQQTKALNNWKKSLAIVKSLGESGLLKKGASETIENEVKEQYGGYLGILSDILEASLLEKSASK